MGNLNNVQRRLAEGVASWLHFEFHCQRGDLFSEKYLSTPVGQILAGLHGVRIEAEVNHPILISDDSTGRRPQIDFAVRTGGNWISVVETKWTGRSVLSLDQLLWDLLRLELLSFHHHIECYFVLAGFRKKLDLLLANTHFGPDNSKAIGAGTLITTKRKTNIALHLDRVSQTVQNALNNKKSKYPHVAFPNILTCDFPHSYPPTGNNMTFQVYAWRVYSNRKAQRRTV
jgi:hypothetical protein